MDHYTWHLIDSVFYVVFNSDMTVTLQMPWPNTFPEPDGPPAEFMNNVIISFAGMLTTDFNVTLSTTDGTASEHIYSILFVSYYLCLYMSYLDSTSFAWLFATHLWHNNNL